MEANEREEEARQLARAEERAARIARANVEIQAPPEKRWEMRAHREALEEQELKNANDAMIARCAARTKEFFKAKQLFSEKLAEREASAKILKDEKEWKAGAASAARDVHAASVGVFRACLRLLKEETRLGKAYGDARNFSAEEALRARVRRSLNRAHREAIGKTRKRYRSELAEAASKAARSAWLTAHNDLVIFELDQRRSLKLLKHEKDLADCQDQWACDELEADIGSVDHSLATWEEGVPGAA